MNLLPNETILRESSGKTFVITTHRVRHSTQATGSASVRSIMLEELASCSLIKTSQPLLLILAAIVGLIGLLTAGSSRDGAGILILCLVIAGVLVLAYFLSQQLVVAFASAGATIRINAGRMKLEDAKDFIDTAEQAKNTRYLLLAR